MNNRKSFPVRYMPVKTFYGWKVLDTLSYEERVVKRFIGWDISGLAILDVYNYVRNKNEAEGYVYKP
jgi:hypothetical protein